MRAHFRAGNRHAFAQLADAGALEEVVAEPQLLRESAPEFALALYAWGRAEDMAALLERATAAAMDIGDDDLVARLQGLAVFWTNTGPTDALTRLDRLEERVKPDRPGERLYLALRALYSLATGASPGTVVELARRAFAGGRIWAENIDSVAPEFAVFPMRHADELDGAERAFAQGRAILGSRAAMYGVVVPFHSGEQAFLRGQVGQAEADARVAVELSHQQGCPLANPPWIALLVEILVERDDLAGGQRPSWPGQEWRMRSQTTGGFWGIVFSRARPRLAQGQARGAVDDLLAFRRLAAETRADPQYIPVLSYLALSLLAVGDGAEARRVAAEEVDGARAWGLARRTGIALRALGLVDGGERGLELLRESIEVLESSPARLEHTRSLAEYGAALRRANRRAEARGPLHAALDAARRAWALAIARRAHEELDATGERLRPLLAGGVESLTPSERRIADLAAEGHSNREIAQSLFLTVKTVENHLTTVYRKLDIHARTELPAALT